MKSKYFAYENHSQNYDHLIENNQKIKYLEMKTNFKGPYYAPEKKEANYSQSSYSTGFHNSTNYKKVNGSKGELENSERLKCPEKNEPSQDFMKFLEELNYLTRNKINKNIESLNILPENILIKMQEIYISGESWNLKMINKLKCSFCKNKGENLKISC